MRFQLTFLLILFFSFRLFSNNPEDSLKTIIASDKNDSLKIMAYSALSQIYLHDLNKVNELLSDMGAFCNEISDVKNRALGLRKMGVIYGHIHNLDKALEYSFKSAELFEKMNDKEGAANCYNNIGSYYNSKGEFTRDFKFYTRSIEYHTKAMNIRIAINDTSQLRNSYNNIGNTYMSMDNYEKGLEFYNKAKEIYYRSGDVGAIEMINLNLGDVYLKMALKNKDKAYLKKSLDIFLEVIKNFNDNNVNNRYAGALVRVGQIYLEMGNLPLALDYLQKGHEVSVFIQDKGAELNATEQLSKVYEKMGEYQRAIYLLHRFNVLKDSLVNQKNGESIEQMQAMYKTAEKDREIETLNNEKALKDSEIARNRSMIFAAVTAFVLVLFLVLVVLSRYSLKKKANLKLSEAYQKIEIKNKQITDSINYSKRIQNAILPPQAIVAKHLKNFFVLYTPKDIVSGDFYWFTSHNNKVFFIVADCTGHGVPGALMSMIGNTLLNEIINQKDITEPGEILAHLNKGVMSALRQGANELVSQEDGMDVSIVSFESKNPTVIKYACANHSIFIKSKNIVHELTGDIYSIGGDFSKLEKVFETREFKATEGDYVIMSSDGYYDQFGGNSDSKYLISRFEALILKTDFDNNNPAELFNKEILSWKGNTKQTDDVLVAGFKV